MLINVKLLNGFQKTLLYKVPDDWDQQDLVGSLVRVPLQKRFETAFIEEVAQTEQVDFKIREVNAKLEFPADRFYYEFTKQLAQYQAIEQIYFFKRIKNFLKEKETKQEVLEKNENSFKLVRLTDEQRAIVDTVGPEIAKQNYYPALIHGVTGGGKTEVYKELIRHAIGIGKSVILLLPEVTLAVQFYHKLKVQLPEIEILQLHSATGLAQKRELWQAMLNRKAVLIVGVHMPIVMPIPNLGLIIVDEEHESGYQEKKHPKINTKEAAILRAKIYNIPIVLGSATPSVSSLYNTQNRNWRLFEIKNRFAGNFPDIKLVKLTDKNRRSSFWVSKELELAITDRLQKKEQIIIFLNRRGFSFFIQCKECGLIPNCSECSVSLTLHENKTLQCHYCGFKISEPTNCSKCKAGEKDLLKKGVGTQQIVSILQKIFDQARIERADLDTTVNKKKWQDTISRFESGEIDILVGTQTITKGYDFKKVTLVGILWADINLSLPIYNSAETTLQQLIQVAGRAGRQSEKSEVIIQTMIDHNIYKYINEIDYIKFYDQEIKNRSIVNYPPVVRLAEIEIKSQHVQTIDREAGDITQVIDNFVEKNNLSVLILGPAAPPVHMIKKENIRKIYLKAKNFKDLIAIYNTIEKNRYKSKIYFCPNPLN